MKRFWWIGICFLFLAVIWAGAQEKVEPVRPVEPIPEKGKIVDKKQLSPTGQITPLAEKRKALEKLQLGDIPPVSGSQEVSPQYTPKQLREFSPIAVLREAPPQYQSLALKEVPPVQGLDGISYQVREFNDFRGGLDLVSAKTKVAPNCAIELENALWNPQGEMYKRPEYSEHSTPPEILNFLYAFYTQAGGKYTMGGSDTALYFWHEDSSDWTYLIGTEGTEGRWDGATFEDVVVGTHEGIVPVVWNGSTFVELGGSVDSLKLLSWFGSCAGGSGCRACSTKFSFDPAQTGWDNNEWIGYTLGFWAKQKDYTGTWDTVFVYDYILSNTDHEIHTRNYSVGKTPINGYYSRIYAWFQIDSIWREGTIDRSDSCDNSQFDYAARLIDSAYTWDSTFAYNDYVFEVVGGTGEGIITYLNNYSDQIGCGEVWNDTGFIVPTYSYDCFDTTTTYRIYGVKFWTGSKFVETFNGSLWLGWTGVGNEQNKNIVVWSATDDLGNWPPENHIIIESDDGDFITGMAKFPGEYTDVPRQEMIVTKNNSLYKIVPSGDAYNFWLIQSGVGCVSNSAISPAEGILLFPDQHGVWAYDKRKPISISAKIDPIFEDWDTENLEDVSAIYNPQDRHYYISSPDFYDQIDTTYPNSGFLCAFPMDSASGSMDGTFAHKIDSSGNAFGNDFFCNTTTSQGFIDIATDTLGRYVVIWKNNGDNNDVYLSRFNSDDEQVGDSLKIPDAGRIGNVYVGHNTVDMDNDGHIIVCWIDVNGIDDVWCQYVDWTDGKVDTNFVVNSDWETNGYDCRHVAVGMNADGIAVVVWKDGRDYTPTNTYEIYGQIYDVPDSAIGGNFLAIGGSSWGETMSAVAVTGDRFLVSTAATYAGSERVQKRVFDIDGTPQEAAVTVSGDNSLYPAVAINDAGYHVITWGRFKGAGVQYDIYAEKYDSSNSVVGDSFEVSCGLTEIEQNYPAVAINNRNIFVIVWKDSRDVGNPAIYYRSYNWSDSITTCLPLNDSPADEVCGEPEIDCFDAPYQIIDTTRFTLAWNIDFHGWSKESFIASAYCYQHSIFDEVKILFANPGDTFVYNYGTQADDIDDPVILTYQSPYFNFGQYPSFDYEMRYATVEVFLDTGNIYLTWYKNYNDSTYYDSLICGSDCRQQMELPEDLWGKNISMKLTTGSEIDDFTLSHFWWEWTEDQNRK